MFVDAGESILEVLDPDGVATEVLGVEGALSAADEAAADAEDGTGVVSDSGGTGSNWFAMTGFADR